MSLDFEKLEQLLAEAAGKADPVQRTAFVDKACGDDRELRAELQRLLAAHERAGNFLESPVSPHPKALFGDGAGETQALPDSPMSVERVGTTVGRYKLLEEIGEGGFGVVYMAEQVEPVQRKVALKIIKAGMDTREVVARFKAERQALALMDHPNIARVFDGGVTQTGRPYFVMELVRGIPITEFCDRRNLATPERLKLFMQVCHAVQHAHQKGIIHRDLKPSNVLVTLVDGQPLPKVIDFGVAKALGQRLTEQTLFAGFLQMVGTPAYMSPEQADLSGVDVDTRADIYALGVLLYELLTGVTPFDGETLRKAALDEVRRMIRETEPPKPSTRLQTLGNKLTQVAQNRHTEPAALRKLVRGDLDWIVMKALEKDRRRRYETAGAFAADVQHHLSAEPVAARPPSTLYRFQKLVRRNSLGFAAGGAALLALIAGLSISTWMYFRERQAHFLQEYLRQEAEVARVHEAELRQKTETGDRIIQAKLRYDTGDLGGSERLLNQIPSSLIEPDPMHASLRRGLGCWHALQERWRDALSNFALLGRIDQLDRDGVITLDYLLYGPALVECGDETGFNAFRRAAVRRFIGTDSPEFAERVCKVSLLIPADKELMDQLSVLYGVAERDPADPIVDLNRRAWTCMTLALVDYRRGDYPKATAWCRECLSSPIKNPLRRSTTLAILAMSYHRSNRDPQARSALAQAHEVFLEGNLGGLFWKGPSDWPMCRILLREADALLQGDPVAVIQAYAKAQSAYSLGSMYASGDGVAQNLTEAANWYRQAAEQGHAESQCRLGSMYASGQGVPRQTAEAVQWYTKAAVLGHTEAQYSLGRMYAEGEGVPKDMRQAVFLCLRAADGGHADAQEALGRWYAAGDGLERSPALAIKWYRKAAAQGNLAAVRQIAWILATCGNSESLDGPSAVTFAEKGVALTSRQDPGMLDVLAAAYAERGDFDKAISAEKDAIALVDDDRMKSQFEDRLRLYEANKPYREH